MKLKKISLICLVSIMLILQCSVIASARSSDYLDAYGVYLTPQSGGKIVFTADVNALRDNSTYVHYIPCQRNIFN